MASWLIWQHKYRGKSERSYSIQQDLTVTVSPWSLIYVNLWKSRLSDFININVTYSEIGLVVRTYFVIDKPMKVTLVRCFALSGRSCCRIRVQTNTQSDDKLDTTACWQNDPQPIILSIVKLFVIEIMCMYKYSSRTWFHFSRGTTS